MQKLLPLDLCASADYPLSPYRASQFEADCGASVTINKYVPNYMTNLELTTKKHTSGFGNFN